MTSTVTREAGPAVPVARVPAVPRTSYRRLGAALALLVAYCLVIGFRPGSAYSMRAFGDISLMVTPVLAAVVALVCGLRMRGQARIGWLLIGAGSASWALGEVIWTWYELVEHVYSPYPSVADAACLSTVPLTVVGCSLLISARSGRSRTALDAMIISGSLLAVIWGFVLEPLVNVRGQSTLGWIVGVAYPIGDVAMMTMSLLVVANVPRTARRSVLLLAAGSFLLSVAHALYAYLVLRNAYTAGTWVDFGWFCGFLLIALGAADYPRTAGRAATAEAPSRIVLPYIPLGAAVLVSVWITVRNGQPGTFLFCLTLVLVLLVVARQLVSARDNLLLTRRLAGTLSALRDREAQLEYQAFHDPMTGLANRALLEDRIAHAIAHQDRSGDPLTLIYVDLDGFKTVNDELGHHSGDLLLRAVAARLTECARSSDTVARIGGDEFAILGERMQRPADDEVIAARIVQQLATPFDLNGAPARIGASVGLARRDPRTGDVEALMRHADGAMYRAKTSGKGRFAIAGT